MKLVVCAYHNVGYRCIEELLRQGAGISLIFTHEDSPTEQIWFSSVRDLAEQHGIPWLTSSINEPENIERVRELRPDFIFSFYYRNMIKPELLEIPSKGALNLHGSYLPKYRGRVPVNWAVINGETETGATLHYMVAKPDAGDMVDQEKVGIAFTDTVHDVFGKVTEAAVTVLRRSWPKLADGTASRVPLDLAAGSYFGGRKPEDGRIDWTKSAVQIYNLIRGVTHPYPGAFTELNGERVLVWSAWPVAGSAEPGRVVSVNPLLVGTGDGLLELRSLQRNGGPAAPATAYSFSESDQLAKGQERGMKVLILGVNGFIGNALTHRILTTTDWEVFGLDMACDKLDRSLGDPRFTFLEGDITINKEWIEYNIKKCDVILPLVAIATPVTYVKDPLRVFELDFEENLKIIRLCHKYKKRVIFPSTSEVYGMSPDARFDEENSPLMLGPIAKERWIYSCAKQMLDRVIYAYGNHEGLKFTLFRPFNWIGPKLDSIHTAKEGSSRVLTQFLYNILAEEPILLVDGGNQRRSFTFIEDGIDALMKIIENRDGCADGKIFNIGNPSNDLSVKELAEKLRDMVASFPLYKEKAERCRIVETSSDSFYGKGYQDMLTRVPSVERAKECLGWEPTTTIDDALRKTLEFYLVDEREKLSEFL